ncbi:fluoride efflux transporter CrcB [Salmonella enterica]|nr:fluoride efflux transporter CrcB [Salmonella enterica]EIS7834245.1 fluoride efflux transporter CrcB [Salmonella enterica]EIS8238444.1 fluoride efflux transporter CrcB [Salmonella enterica]
MFFKSLLAVIVGGAAGCTIRWLLAMRLNSLFPNLPPGTLIVNLVGGFIIGAAMAWFLRHPHLDPVWKLLITTGLCGGMTTFSTFSAEVFTLLQAGNYAWAFASMFIHVTGAIMMTAAGFYLITIVG